jgi:Protein of unknown function (DUF4238)
MDLNDVPPEAKDLLHKLLAPTPGKEPRRHHIVPRFYLRRFADEKERLVAVDLANPTKRKPVSVNDAAVEKDFYTVIDDTGSPSVAVERLLAHIEGWASPAIERASFGVLFPPQPNDRAALSLLIALQLVRGRDIRRQMEAMCDSTMKLMLEGIDTDERAAAYLRGQGVESPDEAQIRAVRDLAENLDNIEILPDANEHIRTMLLVATDHMWPIILNMRWVVGRFPEPALLTSDSPVSYYVRPEDRDPLRGVGLATADEVWYPLDPQHVLMLTPADIDEQVMEVDLDHAHRINQNTVAHAFERVFMHPEQDHLQGLDLPRRPKALLQVDGGPKRAKTDGVNTPAHRQGPRRRRRAS